MDKKVHEPHAKMKKYIQLNEVKVISNKSNKASCNIHLLIALFYS